jgi:hypothetical protein
MEDEYMEDEEVTVYTQAELDARHDKMMTDILSVFWPEYEADGGGKMNYGGKIL